MIDEIKIHLNEKRILFREEGASIFIPLPGEFGELQLRDLPDGDDVIGLVGSDWHTHSSCEGGVQGIVNLIKSIFAGNLLLIKEQSPNSEPRLTIEADLASYLKWLPKGTRYKIHNKA